jgi:flagellar biosynthetic protein FliR
MNLLSEGFPITILTSFFLLVVALPFMANTFTAMMEQGFEALEQLLRSAGGGIR